jgi:hypothetical protein
MRLLETFISRLLGSLGGSVQLMFTLIGECLQALLGKIQWVIVLERLLTRLVVALLKWLKHLSSNQLVDDTLEDILNGLRQQGLREARI